MFRTLNGLWRLVGWRRDSLVFYTYSPRQANGKADSRIRMFDRGSAIPRDVREAFVRARGKAFWWNARYRMLRGARLLYLAEGGSLSAYGWIQRWDPLPRRYRWLNRRGTILGYFWTAPEHRGLGLYGRLLGHCIAISDDREEMPLIVYAVPSNHSSLRGLEKAGFARLGEYEVTASLLGLLCSHRVVSQDQTIAEVLAGRPGISRDSGGGVGRQSPDDPNQAVH